MKHKFVLLGMVAILVFAALPIFAQQTPTPDPAMQVVVVGNVDLGQGVIMVNNYIIAPASSFQPSILHQGDLVVVIGSLLPDGVTIQATSIELFDGMPTPTPTFTPTLNPSITPTVTPNWMATFTPLPPTPTPTDAGCGQENQPVAQRLADAFGVSYGEIIRWHCQGFGFGEIARAYLLADATGATAASFFAQRQAGVGWGEIVKQSGVHPSSLAPGQVIRQGRGSGNNNDNDDECRGNGRGNGNGNGNGNGSDDCDDNGRGNGRGNGNGNGNGNGGRGSG